MHTCTDASGWWRTPVSFGLYLFGAVRAATLPDGRLTTLTSCAVRLHCCWAAVYNAAMSCAADKPSMLHAVLETSTTGRLWDAQSSSPYFSFADDDGTVNQVRYDDPDSLRLKFGMAAELGLRGVGVWHLDALPSGPDAAHQRLKAAMWRAFAAFTQPTALA